MSFWAELKRRNLFRVSVAYLIVAWLIVQIVSALNEPLNLPDWFDTVVVVLLGIGFLLALVLAWAYELTPEGVRSTSAARNATRSGSGQGLNVVIIGLLVIAVAFLAVDRFVLSEPGIGQTQDEPPVARQAMQDSIAFLPLEYVGPPDFAYYADAMHTVMNGRLQRLPSLTVIERASVLPYANTNLSSLEVADALDVEVLLRGTLVYDSGEIRCELTLVDPETNVPLWSDSYPGVMDDPFMVYGDIAMNVANQLNVQFSRQQEADIAEVSTNSPEAYELYLEAIATAGDARLALLRRALEFDDEFVEAWQDIAGVYASFIGVQVGDGVQDAFEAAKEAAERILILDPDSGSGNGTLSFAYAQVGQFVEAEREAQLAIEKGIPIASLPAYGTFRLAVGDPAVAREFFEANQRVNPMNRVSAGFALLAYDALGDTARRAEAFNRGEALYGGSWWGRLMETYLRMGERDAEFLLNVELGGDATVAPFAAMMDLISPYTESPEDGLDLLRQLYADPANRSPHGLTVLAAWAAYFGDADLSYAWLAESARQLPGRFWLAWLDVFSEVRQKPEFPALIDEIGLPEFWNTYGWQDICRPLDDGSFTCS